MRTSPGANRNRLLDRVISTGPQHRAGLARALGVSRTTVTNLTHALLSDGILEAIDSSSAPSPGRTQPKELLGLRPGSGLITSVVFRTSATTLLITTLDGRTVAEDSRAADPAEPGTVRLERARDLFEEHLCAQQIDPTTIRHLHAAVNTQVHQTSAGITTAAAAGGWSGADPRGALETWCDAPVTLENTARLTGLAEYLALPEPRPAHLVYVHLSWGVTLGQVLNGHLVTGSHGGAGEFGHISVDRMGLPCGCGNRGCLMNYVGLNALAERFEAVLGPGHDVRTVLRDLDPDDHALASIITEAGEIVGDGLATVCNLLDPEMVVLGGELAAVGDRFVEAVGRTVRLRALPLVTQNLVLGLARVDDQPSAIAAAAISELRSNRATRRRLLGQIPAH